MMSRFARLHALGKRLGLDHEDLSGMARGWYGSPGLSGLTDGQLATMEMELQARVPTPHVGATGGRPGGEGANAVRPYKIKRFRPASIVIDGVEVALATQEQINKLLYLMTAHGYQRPQLHEALGRIVKRVAGGKNPLDALTRLEARECIAALEGALRRRRPNRRRQYGYG